MGTKKQTGFTIVELLIVIVVIGILAAIVISAYGGVQQRAQNLQTQTVVKDYYKAFVAYAIDHGSYPNETSTYCLGEGYTCTGIGSPSTAANDLIRPYMSNANPLPMPYPKPITYYGLRAGAVYSYIATATLDGVTYPWGMNFILQGDVSCGISGVAGNPSGQNWPNFSRTPNATGATERAFGNVYCRVILPDPSTL